MVLPAHVRRMRRSALRIAAIYACIAFAWIAFSDQIIAIFIRDVATVTHIQTFKGTGFVALTSFVLWRLIDRDMQRMEANLERYRMLFEASPDAVFVVDAQGRYLDANNAALTLSGYSQAELQSSAFADLIMGAEREVLHALAQQPSAEPTSRCAHEHTLQTKAGASIPIELTVSSLLVDQTRTFVCIARDMTAGHQAMTALRQSEARFRTLFEAAPVAIATARNGMTLAANQAYLALFGCHSRDQLVGAALTNQLAPQVRAEIIDRNRRREAGATEPAAYETVGLRQDGTTFPLFLDVAHVAQAEPPFTLVFAHDLSQQKYAETQLRRQTERATALAEVSRALAEAGMDHQRILSSIVRCTADLVGDACAIRLVSEDRQVLELAASYHPQPSIDQLQLEMAVAAPHYVSEGLTGQVARTGVPVLIPHYDPHQYQAILRPERWSFVQRIQAHSALIVPLRVRGRVIGTLTLLRDQTPAPYTPEDQQFVQELADRAALAVENTRLFAANQQELTERRRAEAALRASEERLRTVINTAPIALFALNPEGVFTVSEGKGLEATGFAPGELVGQSIFEVYQAVPAMLGGVRRALAGETHMSLDYVQDHRFETRWTPVCDEQRGITGVIGVALDVTERMQAEAARQQLVSLVEHSSDIVGIAALDGKIQFLNRAGQQLLGVAADAVKSTTINNYFAPDDYTVFRDQIMPTLLTEGRWFGEFQIKHLTTDGLIPIELNAFVLHDQHTGEPIAFANVSRDISARKQAEAELREARAREQAIIHGVGDPMFLKDREGRYLLVNHAAAQIAGQTPEEIIGQFDRDWMAPLVAARMREIDLQVMELGQPVETEETGGIAGTERTMLVVKTPYRDTTGKVQGVIGIARDITERKRQEQIKDDFLALASHELKTPLAALVGYIHLLQRWLAKHGGNERVDTALTAMRSEGNRLDRLINDLLDVSRIQTGRLQLHMRPTNIGSYLSQIVATLQLALPDHPIIVQIPQSTAQCNVDPQRLEQVMSNLLTNAAKYSYEAAPVYVQLVVEQRYVEIAVRDTGLGIPAADIPFIFDRFYQVQRPTRESRPGLGLGLFITQQIVHQHGGTIEAESWQLGGTRFVVRLPCIASTPPEITFDAPSTICPTA